MKRLAELQEKLDLKRKLPGYFNVWVFRTAVIILIVIVVFSGFMYGLQPKAFVYCPAGGSSCVNLFYLCSQSPLDAYLQGVNCGDAIEVCSRWPELCEQEYLLPGQHLGTEKPFLIKYFNSIFVIIIASSFGVNHLIYYWRKNKK